MTTTPFSEITSPLDRRHQTPSASAPHRRFRDTKFNQMRWPAFLIAWTVVGVVLTAYLLYRTFG